MKSLILTLVASFVLSTAQAAEPNGSLWKNKTVRSNMFADKIARDIGDILTIVVQEESEISTSKSSSVNKETTISTQIQRLLDIADEDYPGLAWEVAREFEGGGELSDSQSADSRLSVVVIDRLPNGNLVLEGMRKMAMANEVNYAVLRGYVRPTDIRADNSILSSSIADASIEFIAEGTLTEAQREGWLSRLYSFLSPF